VNRVKWQFFLPFLLLASSLACSTAARYLPPAVTMLAVPAESATWDTVSLQQASEIVAARLAEKASGRFSVRVTDKNQLSVALYEAEDQVIAEKLITEMGVVAFIDTEKVYPPGAEIEATPEQIILTQAEVRTAQAQASQFEQYQVVFALNPAGTQKLADYTRENIGHFLAIVRDGRVVSCPRIDGELSGGEGIITGTFTQPEAEELADLLTHPPLPFQSVLVKVNQ